MPQPLLFVCRQAPPSSAAGEPQVAFVELQGPDGPVFMAFTSESLAAAIVQFYGTAPGVLLMSETDLTKEVVGPMTTHRVVLLHTIDDYADASSGRSSFPWPDRTIQYNFAATISKNTGPPPTTGGLNV